MIGTIVNTGAIITGSIIGSILRKGIKEKYQDALYIAMGLAATGLGINAVVQNMPKSSFPVLFIISLAIGSFIGTVLNLDGKFNHISKKFSTSHLSEGISTGILLFCIGTLSILGPIQSALNQDNTYLFTNATLDFVTSMILASTYGIGIVVTGGILFVWQGAIYLLAILFGNFMTGEMMVEISIIGGFLIASSGLGILKIKDCKTLNMLPSLFVPVIFLVIRSWLF